CFCTALCQPRIEVNDGNDAALGHVQDHCLCCSSKQVVHDAEGNERFKVVGSHLQCGACCPCGKAEYEITDLQTGNTIGKLAKER
ncbi:unnamed protein product, partial [Amoebophrya sp. A25]